MNKKTKKILSAFLQCTLAALFMAIVLYFIPKSTPIDMTVDAVKMDKSGKEQGTVQLHITGEYREYLFRKPQIELEIDDFGNYKHIQGISFDILDLPDHGFDMGSITLGAYQAADNCMCFLYMIFTDDFDRFVICDGGSNNTELAYVASISGEYTAGEIVEYINSFYRTGITFPEK